MFQFVFQGRKFGKFTQVRRRLRHQKNSEAGSQDSFELFTTIDEEEWLGMNINFDSVRIATEFVVLRRCVCESRKGITPTEWD